MKEKKESKQKKQKKNGFTLIEILVSLAILFLIITGVVVFGVQTIQAYTKSRAMQNAIENSRFAIEGLSKRIRTSHSITSTGTKNLSIEDNNTGSTYNYSFINNKLIVNSDDLVGDSNITVSGDFYVRSTDVSSPPNDNRRGFVRILINIKYNDGGDVSETDSVTIQSGVSLRDYGKDTAP